MPDDRATRYARDVVEGRVVAGPHVRNACSRHLADLTRFDVWFDVEAAERVYRFFESHLRLSDGQFDQKPFLLDPSQVFIVGSLFGWRKLDGARRFRRGYVEEGKGNGKSPLAAGIGLYGLLADGEAGAQVYSAATTKEQADIVFQDAVRMAQNNAAMWAKITPSGRKKVWNLAALGPKQKGSFFRPVSRSVGKHGSGPRPHIVLADELHEHASRDVLDILERGFKFRRQPLVLMTTNSGSDRKSVCWEEREHAVAVARGDVRDDSTFAYVCALDEGDDPLVDPSCWRKVNPLLGVTITEEYLAGVVQDALQVPGRRNKVLRLHFCVWTDAETAWISRAAWEACEDPSMRLEDFRGRRCRAGLDLSARKDMTAKALVFEDGTVPDPKTGKPRQCYAAFAKGYTPAATLLARSRVDRAPYETWVEQGYLTATPGTTVRFPYVIHDLVQDAEAFDLEAVAYDSFLYPRFAEDMQEMGAELPTIEHPQGFGHRRDTSLWMPGSVDLVEDLVLEGRLRVQVNPALRSAVAGATFVRSPADLKRFDKATATQRIDLLVALTMAVGAWGEQVEPEGESGYEAMARLRAARQDHGEARGTHDEHDEDIDDDYL